MSLRDQHINRGHHKKRKDRANNHAADQHDADAVARPGTGALGQNEREVAKDGGGGRHQDRTQPGAGGADYCFELGVSGFLQVVTEFHDQNSVLGDQTDESDQADLTVNVERREAEERKHQRARNGQRNRAGKNDERIAEALELRGEHQVDQDRRQQERTQKLAAFHSELTRFTGVIYGESLGQNLLGLILEKCQCLVEGHIRGDYALNSYRIQLLKFIQRARFRCGLQRGKGREWHEFVGRSLHIDLRKLLGGETLDPLNLRDDLVAAPLNAESVDIVPA